MDNKQTLYGINLDDYWYPKEMRPKRGYIGTKEELEEFAGLMETYFWSDEEASNVSVAIRDHFDGHPPRSLVETYGHTFEYVHPLEVLHRSDPIVLEHHSWQHGAANDAIYPMYADQVIATRVVVRDMIGGSLLMAIRGSMQGLRVCMQGTGWISLGGIMSGHPGTVSYNTEGDIYELNMFGLEMRINPEEMNEITHNLFDAKNLNLANLCKDIIAEGKVTVAIDRMNSSGKR